MSIAIFEDQENMNWNANNKKSKRDDGRTLRSNIPKPSKRVALGNLTNNSSVLTQRIQPSRAAKGKVKNSTSISQKPESRSKIRRDENKIPSCIEPLSSITTTKPEDSPMLLSPICDTDSFDEIKSDEIDLDIDDITAKLDTVFGCPEYAHDIHNYMKKLELKFQPKRHYMTKQVDINSKMRAILIDWLVEVAEEYKLNLQTLYLTINYIDRFLSCMSVLRGKLQLVGAACMLVAAKFEEIYPPEVSEFVYITDDSYTAKQVLRMEHLLLKTLSFDISVPTCDSFFTRYLLAAGAKKDSQLQFLVQYLCELTLLDSEITLQYIPSIITASAIYVAKNIMCIEPWTASQEFYTGYQLTDLLSCVREIHRLHSNASTLEQQAIQTKYRSPKYGGVSNLPPATCLNL